MSTPPQDPNQPQDPNRKPNDDGQGQPERPEYGEQDRPQYGQPQYGGQDRPQYGEHGSSQYGEQDRPQYGQPQYGEHAPGYGQPRPGQSVAGQQPPMEHQNPGGQPYDSQYPGNQSQYGSQNPGGQPPYGYQSAQPSAYGYPGGQGQFQPAGPVSRPKEVDISFWLIIAAAALTVVSTIVTLATLGSPAMMEQFEMIMGAQGGEAQIDTEAFIAIAATSAVIIGIIGIAVYLLIAFMVRKGKNWARITATVLAVLSLFSLIGGGFLQIIIVLLGVAAVVLLFTPKASGYFNAVKAQKYGAYGR